MDPVTGEVRFRVPDYESKPSYVFTVTASDSELTGSTNVTINVTDVNEAPVFGADSLAFSVNENLSTTEVILDAYATDQDGDSLTYGLSGTDSDKFMIDPATGEVRFNESPNHEAKSSYNFTVSASDGELGDSIEITVSVTDVNEAPEASDDTMTILEDTDGILNISVLDNDNDVDNDPLSLSSVSTDNPLLGNVSLAPDGRTIQFEAAPDAFGIGIITYVVSDSQLTDTATLELTVEGVNDSPAALADSITVNEDSGEITVDVLANDSDVDGDDLTPSALSVSDGGFAHFVWPDVTLATEVQGGNDGRLDYRYDEQDEYELPVVSSSAPIDLSYTLSVSHPDAILIIRMKDTHEEVMRHQGTSPITFTPNHGVEYQLVVTDNEYYGIGVYSVAFQYNQFDETTYLISHQDTVPALVVNGQTYSSNASPVLVYRPASDFHGTETVFYSIADGNGGIDAAALSVTVLSVNDQPVVSPDVLTVDEDTGATLVDVLANDTDVDLDSLTLLNPAANQGGLVSVVDNKLSYQPLPEFSGVETVFYEVQDGAGGSDVGSLTVTVNPVNDNPVATTDNLTIDEDADPVTIDVLE